MTHIVGRQQIAAVASRRSFRHRPRRARAALGAVVRLALQSLPPAAAKPGREHPAAATQPTFARLPDGKFCIIA